jgi:hypothetical protein
MNMLVIVSEPQQKGAIEDQCLGELKCGWGSFVVGSIIIIPETESAI